MTYFANGPWGRTASPAVQALLSGEYFLRQHGLGEYGLGGYSLGEYGLGEHNLRAFLASGPTPPDPAAESLPTPPPGEPAPSFYSLRLLALGHPYAVDNCRFHLHKLGYADPNDWSIPLPIIRSTEVIRAAAPGEIMRILTKRISPPA